MLQLCDKYAIIGKMANSTVCNRESVTQAILKGKRIHKLTFSQIAGAIGRNKVRLMI